MWITYKMTAGSNAYDISSHSTKPAAEGIARESSITGDTVFVAKARAYVKFTSGHEVVRMPNEPTDLPRVQLSQE